MANLFDMPPISEQHHRNYLMLLLTMLRDRIANANFQSVHKDLEDFFYENEMVMVPKQRMRQLEETEKLALSSLNLIGDLVIGKAKKNDL